MEGNSSVGKNEVMIVVENTIYFGTVQFCGTHFRGKYYTHYYIYVTSLDLTFKKA